ncbi:MAG: hypothetical protein ACOYYJ_00230 [Chloroflexota bacterium]
MPDNPTPWIETKQLSQHPIGMQNYSWQAMFACQIGIRSFEERVQLKWGFNAAVLLEEALDRQRLFLESQLLNNPIDNPIEQRTLALRCICAPKKGLLLGLIGKVLAETQDKAWSFASNYLREIEAIFPYDYTIRSATSQEAFERITGREILRNCTDPASIACIRRFESPLQTSQGVCRVVGIWQTGKRSDEQIWRALAHYPQNILLNISISPTTLYEGERRALLEMRQSLKTPESSPSEEPYLQNYDAWIDPFINRYISPWNKFFNLQIHLVSRWAIDEYLFRSIGSSITRDNPERSAAGFQVLRPMNKSEAIGWIGHLECLDMVRTTNNLLLPRLSELASIDEVHAVFRLPYPPEPGLPDINFLEE